MFTFGHTKTEKTMNAITTAAVTIDEMEAALRAINFFVGGLTDEGIAYYYAKLIA